MGFLRRRLRGESGKSAAVEPPPEDAELDEDERQHELDVLRDEQERLDSLAIRQLRYARYAWQPPAQGGDRRADDHDKPQDKG